MIKLSKNHLSLKKKGSLQLVCYWWINELELAAGCVEAFRNFFNFSGQFWFIEVLLTLSDKVVIILKSTFPLSRAIFLVLSLGFTLPLISVFSFVNRWVINAVGYMVGIFDFTWKARCNYIFEQCIDKVIY